MNNSKNHINGLTSSESISDDSYRQCEHTAEHIAAEDTRSEHDLHSNETGKMDTVELIGNEEAEIHEGPIGGISVFDHDRPIIDLESWSKYHPCEIKLYEAFSILDDPEYHLVLYQWFVHKREDPVISYEEAIYGFLSLEFQTIYLEYEIDPKDPYYSRELFRYYYDQEFINECFTEEELELLRDYLNQTFGIELQSLEVTLPIYKRYPIRDMDYYGASGFYTMYQEEGYSLPFNVCAVHSIPINVIKKIQKNNRT